MKLSTLFFAAISVDAQGQGARNPITRLNSLVANSEEMLDRWFQHVPSHANWVRKFKVNAGRMERNYLRGNKRCSSEHGRRRRATEDDGVDERGFLPNDACVAVKQVTGSFTKWTNSHIGACSGQLQYRHQEKRMKKWRSKLLEFIKCNPTKKCDAGWTMFPDDDRCFWVECTSGAIPYATANDMCQAKNSYLAEIKSDAQNMAVANGNPIGGWMRTGGIWIGGNDYDKEGDWKFADGSKMSYFNWAKDQPDDGNADITQDCIWMNFMKTGEWDDILCENTRSVYCTACSKDADIIFT